MMSDSQAWSHKCLPASTLSAEASPFVPKNFVPSPSPATSKGSIRCTSPSAHNIHCTRVPGFYSSLVPTPALPFYAMQYQCMFPPPAYPKRDDVQPRGAGRGGGRRQRDVRAPRETRGTDDSQSSRDSRVEAQCRGPEQQVRKFEDRPISSPYTNPDLSNNAEFPSLSSSDPEKPQNTVVRESFSYSTALKQKPVMQTASRIDIKDRGTAGDSRDVRKTRKDEHRKKGGDIAEDVGASLQRRMKVRTNKVTNCESTQEQRETPNSTKDCVKTRRETRGRRRNERPSNAEHQVMSSANPALSTGLADDTGAMAPQRSYAAVLHSAPPAVRGSASGEKVGEWKDVCPVPEDKRLKGLQGGSSSRCSDNESPRQIPKAERVAPPKVRMNVSKAKKETHNSALKRSVFKSQQKTVKAEADVKPCGNKNAGKRRKKKSPKVPDLMATKVGVISQELLDFLHGGGSSKVEEGESKRQVADTLVEYPPLEEEQASARPDGALVPLRMYSSIVASKAAKKSTPGASQRSAVTQEAPSDTNTKKLEEKCEHKRSAENTKLRKLVALGNAPTPLHREPIHMHIGSILVPKEKQSKKLKDKENLLSKGNKKEAVTSSANILDSSAPQRKRGKERELPRKKRLSVMKKIILKEREQQKQHVEKMRHAAVLRQQLVENSTVLEERVVEEKDQRKCGLHSKNFREYCDHLLSREINDMVKKLITDLVLFQDRLHFKDPVKARSRRRLVYGLKEVKRYLGLNKLKCIVFAPDIEEVKAEGGLNDSLQDLITCARNHSVPVVFALKRRALGYHTKKCVPVSCIGIFDYAGRESDFRHLIELVDEARKAYRYALHQLESEPPDDDDSPSGTVPGEVQTRPSSQRNRGGFESVADRFGAREIGLCSNDDGWITTNDTDEESDDDKADAKAAKVSRLLADVLGRPQK